MLLKVNLRDGLWTVYGPKLSGSGTLDRTVMKKTGLNLCT